MKIFGAACFVFLLYFGVFSAFSALFGAEESPKPPEVTWEHRALYWQGVTRVKDAEAFRDAAVDLMKADCKGSPLELDPKTGQPSCKVAELSTKGPSKEGK